MTPTRRSFLRSFAGTSALAYATAQQSSAGFLAGILEAKPGSALIGGREAQVWCYSGALPGPAFELQPGDACNIRLRNSLPEPTNLHFHGLHVSPGGNSDNSFLEVPPGEEFDYEVQIPADHRAGLFWYHPHIHGASARQVFRGLAGRIIIRGEMDQIPEIAAAEEQSLVLQDFTLSPGGQIREPGMMERMQGREGSVVTVNGEVAPLFWIRRNGLLRLRILNASVSRYYRLKIEEHPMAVIGVDGGALSAPRWAGDWLLVPGQRLDLIVSGDRPAGSYRILNMPYDRGANGGMRQTPSQDPLLLAYLNYSGVAERTVSVPEALVPVAPLLLPADAGIQRRFILSEGMMASFLINGKSFNPDRADTTVQLGDVEDWEIENRGQMDHPFHMHVNSFQALGPDGLPDPAWLDVINIPRGTRRRIRVRFDDFPGRTLYHCHILDHEDLGMMATLQIDRSAES